MTLAVVWFRKDLRLKENPTMLRAAESADEILPLYVFREDSVQQRMHGVDRNYGYREKFLSETVRDLRSSLNDIGGSLIVRYGNPANLVPDMVNKLNADRLYFQNLSDPERSRVGSEVRERVKADVKNYWTHTLYHPDDLPTDYLEMSDTFTEWRKNVQYKSEVRGTVSSPDTIDVPSDVSEGDIPQDQLYGVKLRDASKKSTVEIEGGESSALNRIQEYIWDKDKLRNYKETRNGLMGMDYSSKLSAWLANGSLSPRTIYEEVKNYEKERVSNDSTYWLIFELMWRDFFQFQFMKHGNNFFTETGIQDSQRTWNDNNKDFVNWCEGETGIPFVDANMRQLNQTGYMSNRGRQNVASFLTDVLDVDWRYGASYFEQRLVDYDTCSNWGNWAYVAGVGNDSRDDRYFNVVKQGERYDSNGEFIRHWVPELDVLPSEGTHRPWNLTQGQQSMYGVQLGLDYPRPIVNITNTTYKELVESDRKGSRPS